MKPAVYRSRIYDLFADAEEPLEGRIEQALELGREYLDLPIGFVSRIDGGTQRILQSVGDHPLIQPTEECPLDAAYCRQTVELAGALAVQQASESTAISSRALETFDLATYVGAKIVVDDEVYGTVCFASEEQREAAFETAEEIFVELLARLVGHALESREYERTLEERNARLAREKERFEGIAETSYDILFRVDTNGQFTYVSSAVERILSYDPADLDGDPFDEIMSERSHEAATAAFEATVGGETVTNRELGFVDADGEEVMLEVNATPIHDDGTIIGVQGVARDISERIEREEELRLKNRAIDETDVGIVLADAGRADDPVVYANSAAERLTGGTTPHPVGQPLGDVVGDPPNPEGALQLSGLRHGDSSVGERILYRDNGTPLWAQIRITPLEDDRGTVSHYLAFLTDVTDRKRNHQLVRLLNRVLRHNLRNDMNVIAGYSEQIRADPGGDVAAYTEQIEETTDKLVRLGQQARDLERHARSDPEPTRLDVPDLLTSAVAEARTVFPDATIELETGDVAAACAGTEIERAVAELLENALRHNPSDTPWANVRAARDGEWVEVTITDDGPGIDDIEAGVVARGEETALEHGRGLGLWLVNWIVTRYGGSFQIQAVEPGTVAKIRLPAIEDGQSIEAAARSPTPLFR